MPSGTGTTVSELNPVPRTYINSLGARPFGVVHLTSLGRSAELRNLAFLTLYLGGVGIFHTATVNREIIDYGVSRKENYFLAPLSSPRKPRTPRVPKELP